MLKLFFKICLVIILAFIPSVGIDYLYRQAHGLTYQFPKNILPLPETQNKYTLVKVGNSHAESGLHLDRYNVKSLDLSTVAQSFEFDFALLKMNAKQIEKNAVIIINVSPLSFSQDKPKKDADINMSYYEGRLSPFLIPRIKISEYLQIQIFPFVRAGYVWRQNYAKEKETNARESFALLLENQNTIITPTPEAILLQTSVPIPQPTMTQEQLRFELHKSSQFLAKVSDIQEELAAPADLTDREMEASVEFMTNKWHQPGFSTESFATNRKDLQDMIDYCLAQGWRPVLITLPMSQVLIDRMGGETYLQEYIYGNLKQINTYDIPYFDFMTNKQITENKTLFSNSDHLNDKGASIVSYLLLQQLIQIHYLPKTADGYIY